MKQPDFLTDTQPPSHSPTTNGIGALALRTLVVSIVIALALSAVFPDIGQSLKGLVKQAKKDEQVRLRLTGFLTQNPAVHWRMAEIYESKGDFSEASTEIELAIGLLELHSARQAVIDRYSERLLSLKTKATAKQSDAGS